jgi:hypothetical protein
MQKATDLVFQHLVFGPVTVGLLRPRRHVLWQNFQKQLQQNSNF